MKKLPTIALSYRAVSFMLLGLIAFMGSSAYLKLPRRKMPAIPIPFAQVITYYPGADALDVETLVTKPLELSFSEINDVKVVYSESKPGISVIFVELVYGSPTAPNWDKLRNKVEDLKPSLPSAVIGPNVNDEFADTNAITIAVSGESFSYRALEKYAEKVRDRLKMIESVGKVSIVGQQQEIINLYVKRDITADTLPSIWAAAGTLKSKNVIYPGAQITPDDTNLALRTTGRVSNLDDLEKIIISQNPRTGQVKRVGDLFRGQRTYKRPVHLIRYRGHKSLAVAVTMRPNRNVIAMGKEVDRALKELREVLPKKLKIAKVSDQPTLVDDAITDFMVNLAEAIAIVLFVAMIFMGWRAGLVMAVAIPMSMLMAFLVMRLINWDLQTISIASLIIALGMLVDNGIVISDNIYEKLREGIPRTRAVVEGAAELTAPVLTSTLTTIAIFLPLAFMSSISGDFIRSIPVVVSVVLGASFLVAMVVTPLASFYLLKVKRAAGATKTDAGPGPPSAEAAGTVDAAESTDTAPSATAAAADTGKFGRGYLNLMDGALRRPYLVLGLALGAFVASLVAITQIGKEFFPNAEEKRFVIDVWLPEGASIDGTRSVVKEIEAKLAKEKDVTAVTSFIGQGPPRFELGLKVEPRNQNYAMLLVATRSKEVTPLLVERLKQEFDKEITGAWVTPKEFQQGPAVDHPIGIRVFGDDLAVLRSLAETLKGILRKVPGTFDVRDSMGYRVPNMNVVVDDYRSSLVGLDNYTVAKSLRVFVDGLDAGSIIDGDNEIPIVMRVDPLLERNLGIFSNVAIPIRSDRSPAYSYSNQLTDIQPRWDVAKITRRGNSRFILVTSKVRGILASEVVQRIMPAIEKMSFPAGYRYEMAGEAEKRSEGFQDLGSSMVLGIMGIIILLVIQFNSFRHPLIILGTLPLAMIGAILGLYVTGESLGFMAFLGIVSLMGVVVNNALVLLDYVQVQIAQGLDYMEALRVAGLRRMRPILLTTLTTVGGLIPLFLTGGAMWRPMAAVLIFGLLVSTLLTLVVIPCMYVVIIRDREQKPLRAQAVASATEPASPG